ncbi:unnamed protein product, partial [Rotaria sp. Silwood1]
MRAGIFPLNPKSIDYSRILQNNESVIDSSSTTTTTNTTNNNSMNNSSAPINLVSPSNNYHNTDDSLSDLNTFSSFNNAASSFASSQEAISSLDRVLQETTILNNSDDEIDDDNTSDNDDDEDYVPTGSTFASSKNVEYTKKQTSKSKILPQRKNYQLTSSRKSNRRKKVTLDLSSFDSTDQDEDVETNSSSKSIQLKKSSLIKSSQFDPSNHGNQQKQMSSIISSLTVSNEDGNIDQRIGIMMITVFLLDDTTVNQSSANSQQSLKAITDTLRMVFDSSKQSPGKAKKRTVLKRPSGQIMTEADVINQIQEAKSKKTYKRSRSSSEQPSAAKHGKKQKIDSSVVSSIKSTISVEPPSQSIVLKQLSTFTNILSSAAQQSASQQPNQLRSYVSQAPQNELSSTNHLSKNDSHNSLISSIFNSVPGALQSTIICSQCRITITFPTLCRTCYRSFCIT